MSRLYHFFLSIILIVLCSNAQASERYTYTGHYFQSWNPLCTSKCRVAWILPTSCLGSRANSAPLRAWLPEGFLGILHRAAYSTAENSSFERSSFRGADPARSAS